MIIQEKTLVEMIKCPLLVPMPASDSEACAQELASWTLQQSFRSKFKGEAKDILHNMRGKVLDLWKGDKRDIGTLARTMAFRLFILVTDYEVIHLEQPYNLILSGYTIQGKYALLRKRSGERLPYLLILHTNEPDLRRRQALPPDPVTMARYSHLYTTTQYTNAQVLHYPVFRGKVWFNKSLNVPLAKKYLESMLRIADLRQQYPVAGDHCLGCATKPCLEIFNG
jgi:hypothetical protein